MKIIRTLKIDMEEFYDFIEQDIIEHVEACTKHRMSAKDIKKGLTFSKTEENSDVRTDVTVLEYERNHVYCSKIKSMTDTTIISYQTSQEENGVHITYEQIIESFENKKHHKLMRMFSEGVYLGRMSDALYAIQNNILKKREEKEQLEPKNSSI